jgi:hypothetical protein
VTITETPPTTMYQYTAFGLQISSEMPIPELIESPGAPDVTVRLGKVNPDDRPDTFSAGKQFWATNDECCVFEDGIATFKVIGGRAITVDPAPSVGDRILRSYLLGPAFSALLYQRGKLMLHGSAVAINGGVVAFFGGPGWGKSTTAAAFHAHGYPVVSDDELVIESTPEGIMVLPAFPQFKLFPDAASAVGADPEALPRLVDGFEKRVSKITTGFNQAMLPFRRAYVLGEGPVQRIVPLPQRDAVIELVRHSLGTRLLAAGGRDRHFLQCAEIARQVPVRVLERLRSLDELADLVKLVEDDLDS